MSETESGLQSDDTESGESQNLESNQEPKQSEDLELKRQSSDDINRKRLIERAFANAAIARNREIARERREKTKKAQPPLDIS